MLLSSRLVLGSLALWRRRHSSVWPIRRCLVLFSELTVAKTRISELEGVVSAMRYAFKHVDLEQCTLCEMDEDFSDA